MADILPAYPPSLSPQAQSFLLTSLVDYTLAHGIAVRTAQPSEGNHLASHAPVTLFPSLFPRSAFEQALRVQTTYNALYAKIANDVEWLGKIMDELVDVDDFVKKLWDLYKDVWKAGIVQDLSLGMFRSDYMIHADPSEKNPTPEIKQVEFNTIASSFGGLSSAVTKLHQYPPKDLPVGSYDRYLYSIGAYGKDTPISKSGLPDNPAAASLAAGLAAAHKAYGNLSAKVLFLVQYPERNIFDQRWIEYHLQETQGVQSRRITLSQLGNLGKLDHERRLLVPSARGEGEDEVSVVYLRAGYGPKDYYGEREWGARRMMELSKAIKCPTVITQLAGCKKVQQVLAAPGVLERFVTAEEAIEVRKTFTAMYPFDTTPLGLKARKLAFSNPESYVLKPQREGGGNNIYRSQIPDFLKTLPDEMHYNAYILMELIQPPPLENSIIREGKVVTGGVVGELGVYGTILWDSKGRVLENKEAGWLLRTKGKGVDEGGVAAGYGSVDSVCLI